MLQAIGISPFALNILSRSIMYGNLIVSSTCKNTPKLKTYLLNMSGIHNTNLRNVMKKMLENLAMMIFYQSLSGISALYSWICSSLSINSKTTIFLNGTRTKSSVSKISRLRKLIFSQKNSETFLPQCFTMIRREGWDFRKYFQINIYQNKSLCSSNKSIKAA